MKSSLSKPRLAKDMRRLIAFRSVTGNHGAARRLLEFVAARLRSLGLIVEIRINEGFSYLVAGTKSLDHSRILLQAHADVVPAPDELFVMRQAGGQLRGRGAYDMLFGVASFLSSLQMLHDNGKLSGLDIGVMLSSDEEIGGFRTARPFAAEYICDVCFLPDAGEVDRLSVSSKGVLQIEISLRGKAGHAGRPAEYDNPLSRLAGCISALESRFPNTDPEATVCSLTTVRAGEALNQVPNQATLTVDIRHVPQDDPDALAAAVKVIAGRFGGSCKVIVNEPAFSLDVKSPIVEVYIQVYESLTNRMVTTMSALGSSDARFFSQRAIPVIMIRPNGGGLHGPDEHVSLDSLLEFTIVLAAYLEKIAGQTL